MSDSLAEIRQLVLEQMDLSEYYQGQIAEQLSFNSDGWSQKVHCIFHDDERPSLTVNNITGGFKCFSCPGEGKAGSVFDFHNIVKGRATDGKNFVTALTEIANQYGIDISAYLSSRPTGTAANRIPADAKKTVKPKDKMRLVNKADEADKRNEPISIESVKKTMQRLGPDQYKYLNEQRGLTKATIQKRMIGWSTKLSELDKDGRTFRGRYTIPVFAKDGKVRNIRRHSPQAPKDKKVLNLKGYGSPARLYNVDQLVSRKWEHVCICAGEFDCMLLNQKFEEAGIDSVWGAVSGTGGEGTFLVEWMDFFIGKHVYFVLDCDDPGRHAAQNHCTRFFLPYLKQNQISSLRIVNLPLDGTPSYKDITDYFVKVGGTIEGFLKCAEESVEHIVSGVSGDETAQPPIQVEDFKACIKDRRYIDRHVRVPISISGHTTKLYHATREFKVTQCPKKDECCSIDNSLHIIPYGDEFFIGSCMAKKNQVTSYLRSVACSMGEKCEVSITKKVVMEEHFAHQVMKRYSSDENEANDLNEHKDTQELTEVPIYILQQEQNVHIEARNYMATGWVRSHPETQQATLFVETLEPIDDDWTHFKVDENAKSLLSKLQALKTRDILDDIQNNVTRIYESDEILMAVLFTYLSPLGFKFDGELIRGWSNICILGDSGTGKSMTYENISRWLELGDVFSVLTGTRTGLLYAIKQKGSEWYVHVGRYVQCHQKIIAIDEVQEAPPEEIMKMAIAMDTGYLQVDQVAQGGYNTKTRTVFLMNPKYGKKISDFSFGCLALPECFAPRFIRRLDLAVFSTAKENYDFYNQRFKANGERILTAEMFRTLVYWAWTRTPDQIDFTEEAIDLCLTKSQELSEKYGQSDDIPLVDPQGFRKKLARLAVSNAILSRSFSEDFESLIVTEKHVSVIAKYIDVVYSSEACNLVRYSHLSKRRKTLRGDFDKIKNSIETLMENAKKSANDNYRESNLLCQLLLLLQQNSEYIRPRDLRDQLSGVMNVSMRWVNRYLGILRVLDLVEIKKSNYRTTRKFNLFMQRWQEDPKIEEMLEGVYDKIGQRAIDIDVSEDFMKPNRFDDSGFDDSF